MPISSISRNEITQVFKPNKKGWVYVHHDRQYADRDDRLFRKPFGVKDDLGWVSSGITEEYYNPENPAVLHDWVGDFVWLVEHTIGKLDTPEKILVLVGMARMLWNRENFLEFAKTITREPSGGYVVKSFQDALFKWCYNKDKNN